MLNLLIVIFFVIACNNNSDNVHFAVEPLNMTSTGNTYKDI
jgi:hypothetical protein